MKDTTKKLCESALAIALATALSFFVLYKMPLGGSVKLCAMLPILLVAIKNGPKWGFGTAFCHGLLQMLLSIADVSGWGLTPLVFVCTLLVDYILAYTVLGIAGCFGKSEGSALIGITLSVVLRFVCHVFSGVVFFASWMPETFTSPLWYSIVYNGTFLGPELALTLVAAVILFRFAPIKKYIFGSAYFAQES